MSAWASSLTTCCPSTPRSSWHHCLTRAAGPANMNRYLEEALDLAAQGLGRVSPNPAVGAVIVRDDVVVGRGFHTWDGLKHAEVLALEQAGERARGATLYVTLEPCSHQGRTPPCADAIVAAGVKK